MDNPYAFRLYHAFCHCKELSVSQPKSEERGIYLPYHMKKENCFFVALDNSVDSEMIKSLLIIYKLTIDKYGFLIYNSIKEKVMNRIQKEKYKELISAYELLSENEKESVVKSKLRNEWHEVFDCFNDLCSKDEVVVSAYDEFDKARKALAFSVEDSDFKKIKRVFYKYDTELTSYEYELDKKEWEKAKYDSEHWEEVESQLVKKLKKQKRKKFLFSKTAK